MERSTLVVGDPPICGGRVLPYTPRFPFKVRGHQVAIIGGRVYCEGCNSIGTIAKAGGPRRVGYITGIALEGDVCVCQCPQPQPIRSTTIRGTHTCDDGTEGTPIKFTADMLVPGGLIAGWTKETQLASQKLVDESVTHPPEAEITENICPNMTNKEFAVLVMALRDEAIALVSERLQELERWDKVSHHRIFEWFGNPGLLAASTHLSEMRDYLRKGLNACDGVLQGLQPENFVRWSPTSHKHLNCINSRTDNGLAAEVCKPDVKTRTIAIALKFCGLERDLRNFETRKPMHGDSQLLTLVHEVTHFDDVFGSNDDWYGTRNSKSKLLQTGDLTKARLNADSLASYILGVE